MYGEEPLCVVVTEAGSFLRLIDSCVTQLKAQGPSRTCNESKEEEEEYRKEPLLPESPSAFPPVQLLCERETCVVTNTAWHHGCTPTEGDMRRHVSRETCGDMSRGRHAETCLEGDMRRHVSHREPLCRACGAISSSSSSLTSNLLKSYQLLTTHRSPSIRNRALLQTS